MRKWFRILAVLLVVAALGGLVRLAFRPREPEPLYQGKPLTYWLQGFSPGNPPSQKGEIRPTYQEVQSAIEHLGTNAIPTLLRLLGTPDHPMRDRLYALLQRQHFIHIGNLRRSTVSEAGQGFMALGANASPAVPQLMRIYERHPGVISQQIVPAILARIGPPARAAVPLLVRATTNDDAYVRNNAVFALGQIGGEPALVVPALTRCLEDPFDNVRANAATALAVFGTNARSAVPALLKLLERERANTAVLPGATVGSGTFATGRFDTGWGPKPLTGKTPGAARIGMGTADVISPATAALKAIDPEAAAKTGVR